MRPQGTVFGIRFKEICNMVRGATTVHSFVKTNMKFYMAFSYSEQLLKATENLIALAALAAYDGRNVVVPFVNNSMFTAKNLRNETQSLALYYNLSALNSKLQRYSELG